MAGSNDLAKLVVRLEAENSRLHRGLESAERRLSRYRKRARAELNKLGKRFVQFSTAAGAALTAIYARNAQGIDRLAKQSDKLGTTTEGLQSIRLAGELTGVAVNTTDMALQRMTRRVSEAAQETGEAQGALKELGLDAKALAELQPDEQFMAIAGAMENVTNQGDRVRLSMRLFDSEGVALVNTLALGESGLRDVRQRVDELDFALSRVDAAKVEQANDEWTLASKVIGGLAQQITVQMAPVVGGLGTMFLDSAREAGGLGNVASRVMDVLVQGAGVAANGLHGIRVVFKGLQVAGAQFGAYVLKMFDTLARKAAEFANIIPGVSIDYDQSAFSGFVADFTQDVERAKDEFDGLLMQKIPSERIEEWVDDVVSRANEAAEKKTLNLPAYEQPDTTVHDLNASLTDSERLNELSSFMGQRNAILRRGLGEESAITKAAFVAQQAAAIPQMIVQTEKGATMALGLGPLGVPLAAIIRGLGYASIAAAGAQSIASFEGGGMTGRGPRAGGMDGKGGFLAMMHPDEGVFDFRKGEGAMPGGGNMNVNMTVQANDPQTFERLLVSKSSVIYRIIDNRLKAMGRRL